MTNEQKAHKATFTEPKVPFYKKASFPWIIIYTAIVLFTGVWIGWTGRSDFANEVTSQVKTVMSEQVSKASE